LVGDNDNHNTGARGEIALSSHRLDWLSKNPTYIDQNFITKSQKKLGSLAVTLHLRKSLKNFLINKAFYYSFDEKYVILNM
jgi:hypothetical protein